MSRWLQEIGKVVVGDLVLTKPMLVDVPASMTIEDTLDLLFRERILSVPVFGRKGGWIGSGGVDLTIGDKQYIGIASIVDILAFIFQNRQIGLVARLTTPISQVLGSTDESLCLWVEPADRPLLYACEMLGKGVHRALVTGSDGSCRLLTQTDVVRFLATHSSALPHLNAVFTKKVASLAQITIKYARIGDSLASAVRLLLDNRITAVPIVDENTELCSQLTISDFRGIVGVVLAVIETMTIGEFLQRDNRTLPAPIICDDNELVGDALQTMLQLGVHRIWIRRLQNNNLTVMTFTDVINAAFQQEMSSTG